MFWGSRASWGRSEDRCDGAGSEADGASPPVKPGHKMPVLGVLVFVDRSALVKPPSSGLRINKARRSPGRFCPDPFAFGCGAAAQLRALDTSMAWRREGPDPTEAADQDEAVPLFLAHLLDFHHRLTGIRVGALALPGSMLHLFRKSLGRAPAICQDIADRGQIGRASYRERV